MNILKQLFGKKEEHPTWEQAKSNNLAYPQESISLVSLKIKSSIGTGWIDKAYLKYPYKTNCRYNVLIEIDLSDEVANNPDLDMGTIEDFFIDELRNFTIAHAISRFVTGDGMIMEFYVENNSNTDSFLMKTSSDPNRLFSFTYEINEDPGWLAVRPLLEMK